MKKILQIVTILLFTAFFQMESYGQLNKAYFYYKGQELLSRQQYKESLKYINTLLGIDSTIHEAWFLRGIAKYNLGDISGSASDFNKALSLHPFFSQALQYKAIALSRMGENDKALESINKAIELKPSNPDYLFTLGVIYFQKKNFAEARKAFTKSLNKDKSNATAWLNRGISNLLLNDTTSALNDYNTSINVNPFYSEAYARRGALNSELSNNNIALNDLNKAIELDSTAAESYFIRAIIYFNLKKLDAAIGDLDKAIEIKPNYPLALFNKAIILYQTHNFDAAIDNLSQLSVLTPNNVLVPYYRGLINYEKGESQQAINDFSKAISLFPEFANAYLIRAEVYSKLGNVVKAESDYKKGQQFKRMYAQNNKNGLYSMLDSTGKISKLVSLEEDFDIASTLNTESRKFAISLAFKDLIKPYISQRLTVYTTPLQQQMLNSAGNLPDTLLINLLSKKPNINIENLSKLLNSDSTSTLVKGIIQSNLEKYYMANILLTDALKQKPNDILTELAYVTNKIEMTRFVEKIVYENNTSVPLNQENDSTLSQNESYQLSNTELENLVPVFPDKAAIYYNIGNLKVYQSEFDESLTWFSKAIELNPKLSEAWFNRGLSSIIAGKNKDGCRDLSHSAELGQSDAYEIIKRFCNN